MLLTTLIGGVSPPISPSPAAQLVMSMVICRLACASSFWLSVSTAPLGPMPFVFSRPSAGEPVTQSRLRYLAAPRGRRRHAALCPICPYGRQPCCAPRACRGGPPAVAAGLRSLCPLRRSAAPSSCSLCLRRATRFFRAWPAACASACSGCGHCYCCCRFVWGVSAIWWRCVCVSVVLCSCTSCSVMLFLWGSWCCFLYLKI